MSMQRTPPPSSTKPTQAHGQFQCDPDFAPAEAPISTISDTNISVRSKRQRVDDSPLKASSYVCAACTDLKKELLDMLTNWKSEQDVRLTSWKADQDVILTKLINDVSDLKNQYLSIKASNTEIEKSVTFINEKYEEIRAFNLSIPSKY
ncbi:unnamed protein product [Arctia plantaginis]|uniref:Uncharacterized protein n=1 Tax=Arctia plantaginis TaxID=874455 RepID=A0A8S1AE03_ARCPL|nr:unnamed protein product [Arctia plantaginis]